jgi:hypothetical protein
VNRVIRNVLIHEISHHFGFFDAGMALIESPRITPSFGAVTPASAPPVSGKAARGRNRTRWH